MSSCIWLRGSVSLMPADLGAQISNAMKQYTESVRKDIETSLRSVANAAMARVKAASPARSGKYRRGWKVEQTAQDGQISFIVYQSKKLAPLTHLLENGHRKRNGSGFVEAQPHIRSVEQWAEQAALEAIRKAVQG